MEHWYHCEKCRLALIAAGATAWVVALIADLARWANLGGVDWRTLGLYAIITGVVAMALVAIVALYDTRFQQDPRVKKAELLETGVMLAAIMLFVLNGFLRTRYAEAGLPLILSIVGVAAVVTEFYVDLADAHVTFTRKLFGRS